MGAIRVLNGEYCLAVNAVANIIGSLDYVWNALRRNREGSTSWVHYPDPLDKRKQWIVYKSLPELTKIRVDQHFGDIESAYWAEKFLERISHYVRHEDSAYFMRDIHVHDIPGKVRACAFLRMLACEDLRDKFTTDAEYYARAAKVAFEDPLNGLKINNPRSLHRKVIAFRHDGPAALIHGMVGNANRQKVTDLGRQFLLACYSSPLKPTYRKVTKLYNEEASKREDWASLTEERVRQILQESEMTMVVNQNRHGVSASRNLNERTIKRRRPSRPDALWCLDGFTIQLRYRDGKDIKSDLYAIAIMDVYSLRILGVRLGSTETATLVQGALRAAVSNTMQRPDQLQYDNSSANKSAEATDLFNKIAHIAFPTAPYNGKSKQIEAAWGHVEKLVFHAFPNFKGGNITSPSLEIKANPDFLKSVDLPDMATVIQQVDLAIKVWNARIGEDHRSPDQRYRDHQDQRQVLDSMQLIEAFWVQRKHQVKYTKDGLTIEVNKERYTYEVESERGIEDLEWRRHWFGSLFDIKYNPDDLAQIALYHDGKFVAVAQQKYEAPMARIDMEDGDGHILAKALAQRDQAISKNFEDLQAAKSKLRANGLYTELDFNIMHKDELNAIEQSMLDDQLEIAAVDISRISRTKPVSRFDNLYNIDEDEDLRVVGHAED